METQLLYATRNQKNSCDFLAIISLLQWSETEPTVSLRYACISVAGQVTLSYGSCADKAYQICVLILRLLILFIWWLPTWFMVPGTKLWLSIIWQTLFNLTLMAYECEKVTFAARLLVSLLACQIWTQGLLSTCVGHASPKTKYRLRNHRLGFQLVCLHQFCCRWLESSCRHELPSRLVRPAQLQQFSRNLVCSLTSSTSC